MRPADLIDTCRASHRRLAADLIPLTDADVQRPSLLPGYSRGHLITHIANKARAHVALFEGAVVGETRAVHPSGYDADRAASAGAHRSARELRADLTASLRLLEAIWDELEEPQWHHQAIMMAGPRTMVEVVGQHLRNVEVHHVDLDIAYGPADWPAVFVAAELTKRLRQLPDRTNHADLLAWLVNRGPVPDLVGPW